MRRPIRFDRQTRKEQAQNDTQNEPFLIGQTVHARQYSRGQGIAQLENDQNALDTGRWYRICWLAISQRRMVRAVRDESIAAHADNASEVQYESKAFEWNAAGTGNDGSDSAFAKLQRGLVHD